VGYERLLQVGEVDQLELFRAVECLLERATFQRRGEVDDGAERGRDRDAAVDGRVRRRERGAAVDADPGPLLAAGLGRDRHVDRARADGPQFPRRCRAGVAENGVCASHEDRGHPSSLDGQHGVSDGEHPLMEAMESLRANASVDVLVC
jgi:hypothetical protein